MLHVRAEVGFLFFTLPPFFGRFYFFWVREAKLTTCLLKFVFSLVCILLQAYYITNNVIQTGDDTHTMYSIRLHLMNRKFLIYMCIHILMYINVKCNDNNHTICTSTQTSLTSLYWCDRSLYLWRMLHALLCRKLQ